MTEKETKDRVRKYFDEFLNKGNLTLADELYTPHAMIHDPLMPTLPTGPSGIKQMVKQYRGAFPDLNFKVEDIVVEKDRVAVRWTATGTQRNTFLGIAPTNKFGSVTGCSISRYENDRIAESWVHTDAIGLIRNLGVELPLHLEAEVHV